MSPIDHIHPLRDPDAFHRRPDLDPATLAQAFESVRSELDAIPEAEIIRINVDVPRAAQVAFGAAEQIHTLLPGLERLTDYDVTPARRLRTYAAAALHAHLVATSSTPAPDARLPMLLREARKVRAGLLAAATALAHFGHLPARALVNLRRKKSHLDLVNNLSALALLLEQRWDYIADKVPLDRGMLRNAAQLALELQIALGVQHVERGDVSPSDAQRARMRAFTLLVRAYDACRHGVTYLRWAQGDAERYVPSLYQRRPRRRRDRPQADAPMIGPASCIDETAA